VPFEIQYEGASNSVNPTTTKLQEISFGFYAKLPAEIKRDKELETWFR
jgi:hypothetical protein